MKITNQDIADVPGGLPQQKMHCSVMGHDAFMLRSACYRKNPHPRKSRKVTSWCQCFGVTDEQIKREIRANNLSTVEQVTNYTKAGGGCGLCQDKIAEIIAQVRGELKQEKKTDGSRPRPQLTNLQKIAKIQEVMEKRFARCSSRMAKNVD